MFSLCLCASASLRLVVLANERWFRLATWRCGLAIPQTNEYSTRLNSPPRVLEQAAEQHEKYHQHSPRRGSQKPTSLLRPGDPHVCLSRNGHQLAVR